MTVYDEKMRQRAAEKADAVADLDYALATIEIEGREPDSWERDAIVEGLGNAFRGLYGLVHEDVDAALTPADQRGALSPDTAKYQDYDLARLRRALRIVEAEPVRQWQHFGPIVFRGVTRK